MFESRHRSRGGSANRWLVVAGAGLVILAFVARMLLDIGHTRVSDLAAVMRPDSTPGPATSAVPDTEIAPAAASPDTHLAAPSPPPATTVAAPAPPVLRHDTARTVTPAAKPVPAPPSSPIVRPAPAPPASSGYSVQIGAFSSEANATKLGARASALGYGASVIPQERSGSTLYLVRVTDLAGATEARQAADSLARALAVKSVVIPPGK